MNVRDVLAMSLQAIFANRLRSVLTLVGIVAGVASIIGVMTGIAVIQGAMEREMSVLGTQTFQVQKWPAGGFNGDAARRKAMRGRYSNGLQVVGSQHRKGPHRGPDANLHRFPSGFFDRGARHGFGM